VHGVRSDGRRIQQEPFRIELNILDTRAEKRSAAYVVEMLHASSFHQSILLSDLNKYIYAKNSELL